MTQVAIFYPILLQVLLTLAVLVLMGPARSQSMRENRQQITDKDVAIGRIVWSEQATKVANNYKNQFELPVLFYAAAAFAVVFKQADALMVGLAWAFAISRVVHAIIHIGPNVVIWRGIAFLVGAAVLLAMWLLMAWRLWLGA